MYRIQVSLTIYNIQALVVTHSPRSLKVGYVCTADGDYLPMDASDFELYQHGENGTAPKECAFQIEAGQQRYTIQVQVIDQAEHNVGNNWEARMVERFIEVQVNGIRGYGVSEFHYNNKNGRPRAESDPEWFYQVNIINYD